ncbi:MAG: hypothetical protein R3D55_00995 [Chloroflexota bacterium]
MTTEEGNGRSRTYTWQDPTPTAQAAREKSGADLFADMIGGSLPQPPIADTLDFSLTDVGEGTASSKSTALNFTTTRWAPCTAASFTC